MATPTLNHQIKSPSELMPDFSLAFESENQEGKLIITFVCKNLVGYSFYRRGYYKTHPKLDGIIVNSESKIKSAFGNNRFITSDFGCAYERCMNQSINTKCAK